jgi:hypothetical protein
MQTVKILTQNIKRLTVERCQLAISIMFAENSITMEISVIQNKIFEIRGQRVMLDFHLAELYQIETKVLNQAVKRNIERFPPDFMFQLDEKEFQILRSQIVTSSLKWGGLRRPPFAFTELGIAMLSSVLRSPVAIEINIRIMRAFVELRKMIIGYEELSKKIEQLELETNTQFSEIYQALTELAGINNQKQNRPNPVGYITYPDKK